MIITIYYRIYWVDAKVVRGGVPVVLSKLLPWASRSDGFSKERRGCGLTNVEQITNSLMPLGANGNFCDEDF